MALSVIKLKNDRDSLQGINKLGYRLKVSVFQKYKIVPLQFGSTLGANVQLDWSENESLESVHLASEYLNQSQSMESKKQHHNIIRERVLSNNSIDTKYETQK